MAITPIHIAPVITAVDGHAVTTSIAIAEFFSKRHDDVLKKVRSLECSSEFHLRNFAEMVRDVPGGDGAVRRMPCYQITRDGFAFLAMGFTGKRAAVFKESYIDAFNQMETQLAHLPARSPAIVEKTTLCHPTQFSFHQPQATLTLERNAITQLNALFGTVDFLNQDFWPKIRTLFPSLGNEYRSAFETADVLLHLLKTQRAACETLSASSS